jgi:NTE family protein
MTDIVQAPRPVVGLILAGGGARAAYQVGVLRAISALLPPGAPSPFPVICGSSAGAINAATLAIYATRFHEGVRRLAYVWGRFHVGQVFRTDARRVLADGLRWGAALMFGGLGRGNPRALLDRAPLRRLIERRLDCARIRDAIKAGALRALSITCSGYGSGDSVSFYQGVSGIVPWRRARRVGCPAEIGHDHLMASSALPFLFSAEKIHREYFGDGSMRQVAPLSPAIHLGAERLFVIGLRPEPATVEARANGEEYPPLAQIAGHVLNSIFLDSLEADLERLERINRTIRLIPPAQRQQAEFGLREVQALVIAPSQDPERIAARHAHYLPRTVRFLLHGAGVRQRHGANLVSYLLFEAPYCRELMALGYADAMMRRQEIVDFLGLGTADTPVGVTASGVSA